MSASSAKYLLCAEAVTAAGFNLDVSVAVAESDLDMYDTATLADQEARITVAPVTYLESDAAGAERALALLTMLVEQLTARLPGTVSSVPLYVRMPEVVTQRLLDEWLQTMHAQESSHKTISCVKLSHDAAHAHFTQVLNVLAEEEILLAVSIDAPIDHLEALAADNQLQTNQHPWGVIASEGGAGVIMASRSFVEAMKIEPLATFDGWSCEPDEGHHLMSRVLRRHSRSVDQLGLLFSDMTNLRTHQEDYGFAVGAKGEVLLNPEQVIQSHSLWGYLGHASLYATLALAARYPNALRNRSAFLFGADHSRAMLTLTLAAPSAETGA